MAQILKINNSIVLVGLDDGLAINVSKTEFNFEVSEYMEIAVYKRTNGTYDFTKISDVPGYKYVKKIPYCILSFFGVLGVDEMYAGNFKGAMGRIVMLLAIMMIQSRIYVSQNLLGMSHSYFRLDLMYIVLMCINAVSACMKESNEYGEILVKEFYTSYSKTE